MCTCPQAHLQIEDSARVTFSAVEAAVSEMAQQESKRQQQEDLGVTPLTAYILNYIKRLQKYGKQLRRWEGAPGTGICRA